MNPEEAQYRALLPGYITGQRDHAAALEAHLEHCAACRRELQQWRAIGQALEDLTPSARPPIEFEASWEALNRRVHAPEVAASQLHHSQLLRKEIVMKPLESKPVAVHAPRRAFPFVALIVLIVLGLGGLAYFRTHHVPGSALLAAVATHTSTAAPSPAPATLDLSPATFTITYAALSTTGVTTIHYQLVGTPESIMPADLMLTDSLGTAYRLAAQSSLPSSNGAGLEYSATFSPSAPAGSAGKSVTLTLTFTSAFLLARHPVGNDLFNVLVHGKIGMQATYTTTVGGPQQSDQGVSLFLDKAVKSGNTYILTGHTTATIAGNPHPVNYQLFDENGVTYNDMSMSIPNNARGGVDFTITFQSSQNPPVAAPNVFTFIVPMMEIGLYPNRSTLNGTWQATIAVSA